MGKRLRTKLIEQVRNGKPLTHEQHMKLWPERFCPLHPDWSCYCHKDWAGGAGAGSDDNNKKRSWVDNAFKLIVGTSIAAVAVVAAMHLPEIAKGVKAAQEGNTELLKQIATDTANEAQEKATDDIQRKTKDIFTGDGASIEPGQSFPATLDGATDQSATLIASLETSIKELETKIETERTAHDIAMKAMIGGVRDAEVVVDQFERPQLSQAEKDLLALEIAAEDPNNQGPAVESKTARDIVSNVEYPEPKPFKPQFPESQIARQNGTAWPAGSPAQVTGRATGSFAGVTGDDPLEIPGTTEEQLQIEANNIGIDGPFDRMSEPTQPAVRAIDPPDASPFGLTSWEIGQIIMAFFGILWIRSRA